MSVIYKSIDNEEVSVEWYTALMDCRRAGVAFNVNEGHRTMARQTYFWSGSPNNPNRTWRGNLAARPSPYAPHIRSGRFDHALDLNNAAGVMRWLRAHGIRCSLTVPGESWHVEANADDLRRYHQRNSFKTLRFGSQGTRVKWVQRRLRDHGYTSVAVTGYYGEATRKAVWRLQKKKLGEGHADGVVGRRTWRLLG